MPLPIVAILAWATAAVVVAAVIVLVVLNWKRIVAWFKAHQGLKEADKNHIAFTLQEKLASGDYKTIQGVFNKRTSKVVDGQVYEHEKMDAKLANAHEEHVLAVYE